LLASGETSEAKIHYLAALSANAQNANVQFQLGVICAAEGDAVQAVSHFREAARLAPERVPVLNSLAWVLATSEDASLRNGPEAVQCAERAARLTEFKNPPILDTLAAAYAESGQFDNALNTAQKAIDFAVSAGNRELAAAIRVRLADYKSGRPYRE
jgi:Flp pilus assembly protein TadD